MQQNNNYPTKAAAEAACISILKEFHNTKADEWADKCGYRRQDIKTEYLGYIYGYFVVVGSIKAYNDHVKLNTLNFIPAMYKNTYWWIGIFDIEGTRLKSTYTTFDGVNAKNFDIVLTYTVRPWIAHHPLPDRAPKQLTLKF